MPGTPVTRTALVAGATITAATLNTNFENINTYLDDPGLENEYIENPKHNVVWTWHMEEIPTGTARICIKVPSSGFSTGGITLIEAQLFLSDEGSAGVVNVNIHDGTAFPPTSATRIIASDMTVDTDNGFDSATDFTQGDHGPTFPTGEKLYVEYEVTGNPVNGVTISLFAKAFNRS